MNGKSRINTVVTHEIRDDGIIVFNVAGAGSFEFDVDKVSEECATRAAIHGFVQRISDGAAISRDQAGNPATPQAKLTRMRGIAEHYMTGTDEWAMRAAGNGGDSAPGGMTIAAMVISGLVLTTGDANDLVERLADKRGITRKEALVLFAKTDRVAEAMEQIRLKKAPRARINVDDLLEELQD